MRVPQKVQEVNNKHKTIYNLCGSIKRYSTLEITQTNHFTPSEYYTRVEKIVFKTRHLQGREELYLTNIKYR